MTPKCLARPTRGQLLRSDISYWMRNVTIDKVAEVITWIAFLTAVFVGLPIIAALLV